MENVSSKRLRRRRYNVEPWKRKSRCSPSTSFPRLHLRAHSEQAEAQQDQRTLVAMAGAVELLSEPDVAGEEELGVAPRAEVEVGTSLIHWQVNAPYVEPRSKARSTVEKRMALLGYV